MSAPLQHPLAQSALAWASATRKPSAISDEYACPTRDVFRARLDSLMIRFGRGGVPGDTLALTEAVLSEIGNNAFDHNVGNWRDIPGVFFAADVSSPALFVIADRGQGIL